MRLKASFFQLVTMVLSAVVYAETVSAQSVSEPTWPQSFVAATGKPAGFGFAVTQPGPISVSVQSGAALLVTLSGPLPNPIQQGGTGNVQLSYVATAADVQRSYLWMVQIASITPQPVQGIIRVSHPPADMNLASRQVRLLRQRYAQSQASIATNRAAANQAITAQQQAKQQAQQHLAAAQVLKTQQLLNLMAAPAAPTPPAPGVTTRGLPANPIPIAAVPAQLSPAISSLSVGEGQPGDPVLITGSSFGSAGQVHFVLNPGMDLVAPVDRWTSTQILAHVPAAQGIQRYIGSVYVMVPPVVLTVVTQNRTSAAQQFIFDPQIDTQVLYMAPDTGDKSIAPPSIACGELVWCDPGGCPPWGVEWAIFPYCSAQHGSGNNVAGSGDDQWYLTTNLKNGWIAESTNFSVVNDLATCGGTANIVPIREPFGSSSLYTKVHWSQAATCNAEYFLSITVKGPLGTSPF